MSSSYIELHAHSHYSLLDGASSPQELLLCAQELDLPALALTDHDNVYGAVEFGKQAQAMGVRAIHGAELTLHDGHHLTLLVKNETGWSNLCHLITLAQHNAPKGRAYLPPDVLKNHTGGLVALSGCKHGAVAATLLRRDSLAAENVAAHYRDQFGRGNFYIELQHHLLPEDDRLIAAQIRLAKRLGIPYVATNNVHYATREGQRLQDILTCISHLTSLEEAEDLLRPNDEYHLKSSAEMLALFRDYPEAIANTLAIAEQCEFHLTETFQALPTYPTPDGTTTRDHLQYLCRISPRYTSEALGQRLDHELAIIERAGLCNYFLVVWDIVRYAREQGIRCQGRGSAANSVVAYLLYITPVNPLDHNLVFERFLSDERQVAPDIDLDFDNARREEVIQYVYQRYGTDHAAMACTFITFRARSAVRDVGKAMGLSNAMVDHLAKQLDARTLDGLEGLSPLQAQLLDLCQQIEKRPRHLSIHNGGMVIGQAPLATRVPTEPAAMPGRTVVQWDKEGLEDAGIVKIDLLGLAILAAIDEASELAGVNPDTMTFDDPAVYDMICDADTIGVFQVESRAQMQVLPRMRPRCFADLVISISLIRPGPLQGDMVHPFLRRRLGEEPVSYLHPDLEDALTETLGVILFQEQVLKVAHDLAGFTPGQGELLRRALGRKDAVEAIRQFEVEFVSGAMRRGVDEGTARLVFGKLLGFGSYSFPKSHAASFAVLVYQSAWLRCYHPIPFYVALLNNQPMGFYRPSVIVNDAKRHGLQVLPVHINTSCGRCMPEGDGFRLGFNYVRGMGTMLIERLLDARSDGPFTGLEGFCQRTGLPVRMVENLIQAGAMADWGISQRDLIWQLGTIRYNADELDLPIEPLDVDLPNLTHSERLDMEYRALGLSTGQHVMVYYRDWLDTHDILSSAGIERVAHNGTVRVAGLVIVRQAPPTAKGFQFITLEDEFGFINVIVRPKIYQRFRRVIRSTPLLMVSGKIQIEQRVLNLIATSFRALPPVV